MGLRLSLFAKGNTDLRDSLHLHAVGEKVLWNGINQVLRDQKRDCTIRVRHETHTCFAAMSANIAAVLGFLCQFCTNCCSFACFGVNLGFECFLAFCGEVESPSPLPTLPLIGLFPTPIVNRID